MQITKLSIVLMVILVLVIGGGIIYFTSVRAPVYFPTGALYTVPAGSGLTATAKDLKAKQIIRSPFLFKTFLVLNGGPKGLKEGDYVLLRRQNVWLLARRFAKADFGLHPVSIALREGLNVMDMAKVLSIKFPKIEEETFITLAGPDEGYLFPDTYLFLPNVESEVVIATLKQNFQKRISTLNTEINNFSKPLVDIIKMASIVEKEARTFESRQMVAGILWKRLEIGMPLQVDVSFKYINGKVTKNLTFTDLKIDSPYNSYLYKGLPPTPIANPGLSAIKATVTPTKTSNLFFLSDRKGNMHYAKTYAEHMKNKALYLD